MGSDDQVQIGNLTVPEDMVFPEFANAFRIVPEPGGDCIVEFIVHVAQSKRAKVVSRARIRNEFLIGVRDTINKMLPPQHQQPVVHPTGQLVTADGEGITVFLPGGVPETPEEGN